MLDGFALIDAALGAAIVAPALVPISVALDGFDFEPVAKLAGFAIAMGGWPLGMRLVCGVWPVVLNRISNSNKLEG